MQQRFTILMFFYLSIASPAISQTTLLTGNLLVQYNSNMPPTGDSSTFAYNSNFQLNERVFLKLDTNGNWNLKTQFLDYVYDAEGNNLYYLVKVMDASNTWINFIRNTYTYDADDNELSYLSEKWDTTAAGWVNAFRKTSTYYAEGKKLSYIQEKWNGTAWVNQQQPQYWVYDTNGNVQSLTQGNYRTLYTYNAQNLVETVIAQEINGAWIDKRLAEYTYLPNDTKIATESTYFRLNNAWEKDFRYSDTYDANENLVQRLTERGNGANWENNSLESHIYNANGFVLEDLVQNWVNTSWGNSSKNLYIYDANDNPVYWIWKLWESGNWENVIQQFNGFDANSNFISSRQEDWDGIAWNLGYLARNHYTEFVSTDNPTLADFEVFPNPANASITLKGEGFSHVMIFDQQGRVVRSQSLHGQGDETLQMSSLPSGNYFLQVLGKDGKSGAKLLQIRR